MSKDTSTPLLRDTIYYARKAKSLQLQQQNVNALRDIMRMRQEVSDTDQHIVTELRSIMRMDQSFDSMQNRIDKLHKRALDCGFADEHYCRRRDVW